MEDLEIEIGGLFHDRFIITKELGSGSYGSVFEAVDLSDHKIVAIKLSFGNHYVLERGIMEAKVLEAIKLQGPTINRLVVEVKACYVIKKCVVLVLELLGQSLLKSINDNQFNDFFSLSYLAREMIEFLHAMSIMNITHCDIKPENILVNDEGNAIKFADFGLAHCPSLSRKEPTIQSLAYRAPEVVLGLDYDRSVDTWSVGCTLVSCFTKRFLFPVTEELNLMAHIAQVMGTPKQHVIESAPNRDTFYDYDPSSQLWTLKGCPAQVTALGLRNFLKMAHDVQDTSPEYLMFLDLIEGMMKLEPSERYSPQKLLNHPFTNLYQNDPILQLQNH